MPSTNVQELYEKFMDDPEYIGRESLALAEAQQRVRQSINNHKALSMAKAVTPMESLLEFLIKKSVEDNIPAHFQRNTDKELTNLVVPEGDTEMSHQDLLDAIWTELLPLAPEGSTIEDILADPSLLGQGITAQGHQMFSHTERGEFVGAEGIEDPTTVDDEDEDDIAQAAEDVSEADPDDFDQAPDEELDDAGEEVARGRQEGEGVTVSRTAGSGLPTEADYGTRRGMHMEDAPTPKKGFQALDALNELGRRAESPEMKAKLSEIRDFVLDFNRNEAVYANQPTVMGRNPLATPGPTTTRREPGMTAGRTRMPYYMFHQALEKGLFEQPESSKVSPERFNSILSHVVNLVDSYKGLEKTHRWPKTNGGFIHGYNIFAGEPDENGIYSLPEGFTKEDLAKELKAAGLTMEDIIDKNGNINSNAGLSDEGIKARQLQQQILSSLQALTGSSRHTNMYDALDALIDIGENPATHFARKGVDGDAVIRAIENARGDSRYSLTEPTSTQQDPVSGELFDRPTEEESQAQDFASYQNSRTSALEDLHEAIASLSEASSEFRHPSGNPERVTHPISPQQNYMLNNVIGEAGSLQSTEERSQRLIDAVASTYNENPEQYMTYKGLNDLITDTAAELGLELPSTSHLNQIERDWISEKNSDGSYKNAPKKEVPSSVPSDMSEMNPRDLQRMSENEDITLEQYLDGINQITKKYPYKVKSDIIRQAMFSAAKGESEIDPGLGSASEDEDSGREAVEDSPDIRTSSKDGQITAGGGLGGMFRVDANGFWDINEPEFLKAPNYFDEMGNLTAGGATSFVKPDADIIGGQEKDRSGKALPPSDQWTPPPSKSRTDKLLDLMRPNDIDFSRDPISNAEVMPDVRSRPKDLQRDILEGGYPVHYANEHQQDWERWKPLMDLHMQAGVPLEDFVSINPDTGQKIWSPESMTYGHQKHGFANWGEDHKPRSVPAPRTEGGTSGMYEQMLSDRASEGIAPFLPGMSMGNNDPNIHIEEGDSLQSNLSHSASKRRQAWIQGRTPWQVEKANKAGGLNSIFKQMRNHWNRTLHQERSRRPENKIGAESLNGANDPIEDPFNRTRNTHSTEDTKDLGIYGTAKGRRDMPTPSQMKRHSDPEGLTDSKYYEVLLDVLADAQDDQSKQDENMSTFADSDKALTGELQSKGYIPHPEGENSPHSTVISLDSISDDFPDDEEYTPDRVRSGVPSVDTSISTSSTSPKGSIQRAIKAIERAIGLATVNNYQSSQPGKFTDGAWKAIPLTRGGKTIQSENGYDEVMQGGPDGQGINTLRQASKADHLGNPFALKDEAPEPRRAGVAFKAAYSDQHGNIPASQKFEVSTKGNDLGQQFSALKAKLPNGRTIEDVYKKDIKGGVGSGKVPEGMSKEDLHKAYTDLWRQWADANPEKLAELAEATRGKTLTDVFAYSTGTGVSQARSLAEILNERHGTDVPEDAGVEYVNHSGGAHGADQDWDFAGASYGVTSNHYHMMDEKAVPRGHLHTHTLSRANQADVDARLDNLNDKVLKRGRNRDYHSMGEWAKDNFRRNALGQVDNSDGIFAISTIGKGKKGENSHAVREGIVDGGTAWAVHLAIQEGKQYKEVEDPSAPDGRRYINKPVYVFDQEDEKWYEWNYSKNKWDEYKNEATDNTPTLTPHFAGIGTREINVAGNKAIRDVYRHTFGGDALEHPVDSSVRKFEEWLRGTAHQDVEPERRQAILNQIKSGALNGRRLDYYTKEHADAGRYSHADVLAKLINENKVTREQGVQGFLKALEPHKAVFDAFNSLSKRDKQYIFDHFFPQKEGLGQVGGTIYSQHGQPFRIESVNRDTSGYYKGTMTVQQMQVAPENYMIPGQLLPTDSRPRVLQFKEGKEGERAHWVDTDTRYNWEDERQEGGEQFTFYSSDPTKESSALSWSHGGGIDGYGFTAAHDAYAQAGGASSAPGQSTISPRENILAKLGYYPDSRMAFKENIRSLVNDLLGSGGEVDRVDLMQALESVASDLGLSGIELPRAHEMSKLGSTPYEQTLGELRKFKALYPERMTDEDEEHLQLLEEQAADEEDGEDDTGGTPAEAPKPGPGSPGGDNTSLADVPPAKLASALGSSATGLSAEPDQRGATALLERKLPVTKVDDTAAINHATAVNNGWGGTTDNAHEIAHYAHHAVNPDLYPGNGSHPLADLGLENLTEETEEGIKPHPELHNILGLPSNALIDLQHIKDIAKATVADGEEDDIVKSIDDYFNSEGARYHTDPGGTGDDGPSTPPTAEGADDYGGFDHMDEAYGLVVKIQKQQDSLNHPLMKTLVDPITPQELERYNEAVEYLKARTKDGRISIDPSSHFFNTPLIYKERDEILTAFKNHNKIMTDLEPIGDEYLTIPEEQGEQEENIFDPPYEHKEGSIGAKIQELADNVDTIGFQGRKQLFDLLDHAYGPGDRGAIGKEKIAKLPTELDFEDQVDFDAIQPRIEAPYNEEDWPSTPSLDSSWIPEDESHYLGEAEEVPPSNQNHVIPMADLHQTMVGHHSDRPTLRANINWTNEPLVLPDGSTLVTSTMMYGPGGKRMFRAKYLGKGTDVAKMIADKPQGWYADPENAVAIYYSKTDNKWKPFTGFSAEGKWGERDSLLPHASWRVPHERYEENKDVAFWTALEDTLRELDEAGKLPTEADFEAAHWGSEAHHESGDHADGTTSSRMREHDNDRSVISPMAANTFLNTKASVEANETINNASDEDSARNHLRVADERLQRYLSGGYMSKDTPEDTKFVKPEAEEPPIGEGAGSQIVDFDANPNYSFADNPDNVVQYLTSEGPRDIVVVNVPDHGPQAFYRSTGVNSGRPGTWFPLDGIVNMPGMRFHGWVDKHRFIRSNDRDITPELDRYGKQNLKDMSDRLGEMDIPEGKVIPEIKDLNSWINTPESHKNNGMSEDKNQEQTGDGGDGPGGDAGAGGSGDGPGDGPGPGGDREEDEQDPAAAAIERIQRLYNEFEADGGTDEESRKNWWENQTIERQQQYHADRKTIEDINSDPSHPAHQEVAGMIYDMEDLHNIASPTVEEEEEEDKGPDANEQVEINRYVSSQKNWNNVYHSTLKDGQYIFINRFNDTTVPAFKTLQEATQYIESFNENNIIHKEKPYIHITTPVETFKNPNVMYKQRQESLQAMASMLAPNSWMRDRVGADMAAATAGDVLDEEQRDTPGLKYIDDDILDKHTRLYGDTFEGIDLAPTDAQARRDLPDALLEIVEQHKSKLEQDWVDDLAKEGSGFTVQRGSTQQPHWYNPSTGDTEDLQLSDESTPHRQLFASEEARALHKETLNRLMANGVTPMTPEELTDMHWPGTSAQQNGVPFWSESLGKDIDSLYDVVKIGDMYKRFTGSRGAARGAEGRGSLVQQWGFPSQMEPTGSGGRRMPGGRDSRNNQQRTDAVKARLFMASQHLKMLLLYMNKHWTSELHDPINFHEGQDVPFYFHREEQRSTEQRLGRAGDPITGSALAYYPTDMPNSPPVEFRNGTQGNQYIRQIMRQDKLAKIEKVYDAIANEFTTGLTLLQQHSTEYKNLEATEGFEQIIELMNNEFGGLCYPDAFKELFTERNRPGSRDPNNRIEYAEAQRGDLDEFYMTSRLFDSLPISAHNAQFMNLHLHNMSSSPDSNTPVPGVDPNAGELFDKKDDVKDHPDATITDENFGWIVDNGLYAFYDGIGIPASNGAKITRDAEGKFIWGARILGKGRKGRMIPEEQRENADLWATSKAGLERFSSDDSHELWGNNWHKLIVQASPDLKRAVHHALETLSDPAAKKDPRFNEDEILHILRTSQNGKESRVKKVIELSDKFRAERTKQNKENDVKEKAFQRGQHWDRIKNSGTLLDELNRRRADDPEAVITPDEATEYARGLVQYVTNLYNHGMDLESTKKDRDGLSLADKVAKVNELVNEAVKFGADVGVLDKELEEFGRGPDKDTPFGSDEHMESARQADAQRSAEKNHYDDMMDSSRYRDVRDAWNDETHEPDGLQEFDEEPSSDLSDEDATKLREWESKHDELNKLKLEHETNVNTRPSDEEYERRKAQIEDGVKTYEDSLKQAEKGVRHLESMEPEDWSQGGFSRWDDPIDGPGQYGMHQHELHYQDGSAPTDHAGELAARKDRAAQTRTTLEERQKDLEDYTKDRDVDPNIGLQDATSALDEHEANKPVPTEGTSSSTWKPAGKLYSNFKRALGGLKTRHTFSPEREGKSGTTAHTNPPAVLGMPAEHVSEYHNLHHDIADTPSFLRRVGQGEDTLETRTNDLRTKLAATGHDSALDHPHFGTYDRTTKVDALTKQPPKHPTTGKQMSLIPDVGWADKDILQGYQKEIGSGQGVYHPKGLIHDEDGNVTHHGLYIDRSGFHGVEPVDDKGQYTHANIGEMTPAKIRQHDLGHKIGHAITSGKVSTGGTVAKKNSSVEPGVEVHRFNDVTHPSQWESPPTKPSAGKLNPLVSTAASPTAAAMDTAKAAPQTAAPTTSPSQRRGLTAGLGQAAREARTSKIPFLETMSSPTDFQGAAKTARDVWSGTGTGVSGTQVGAGGLKGAARAFYNPGSTQLGAAWKERPGWLGGKGSSVEKSRPQSLDLLDDYIKKANK